MPERACQHCGAVVDNRDDDDALYCCIGCEAAARLIAAEGLERYRTLADGPLPPGRIPAPRSWLGRDDVDALVDVQGITCGACVWVIEKVAHKRGVACAVNPGIGRMSARAANADTLREFLDDVETLGYRVGPPRKSGDGASDALVLRAGICGALAMAAMSFAFARYFGLEADTGPLDGVDAERADVAAAFLLGEVASATLAVVVGGSYFVANTVRALRLRVVPLDLPVAAGLVLAFVGSVAALVVGAEGAMFFDSLAMFAALMLIGRLAQRAMIARSRAQLLEDAGFDALTVTLVRDDRRLDDVGASALVAGDRMLLRPGDALPVSARMQHAGDARGDARADARGDGRGASFSLAWLDGESEPRAFHDGDTVPAGACLDDDHAVTLVALEPASSSRLWSMLGARDDDAPTLEGAWQRWAAGSVLAVLAVAAFGAAAWWPAGPARALEVATAILVVTCPCALGLALPLAAETAHASLRKRGVFVRRAGFLDRMARVRHVVLDKTGTLTMGELKLTKASGADLAHLDDEARAALYDLVARSRHPKSRALRSALERMAATCATSHEVRNDVHVVEEPGVGLVAQIGPRTWRLANDALSVTMPGGNVATVARFTFEEALQHDAAREVRALRARGLHVVLASGDQPERARDVGARLEIAPDDVHGALSPEDKASLVRSLERNQGGALFVGDGINDAAAFAAATCAGTPALDRPQLPARADFYVVHRGLGPLAAIVDEARVYRRGARAALAFAVVYNVAAVGLALAGVVTPLAAAVSMPASSIAVVVLVRALMARDVDARAGRPAPTARAVRAEAR
jgi:Cu2+-exporting ATPase